MALPHSAVLSAGSMLYRISSPAFLTKSPAHHPKVVNGQGALHSPSGARFNHGMVPTVYLAENPETALAEIMFYFQREYLQTLDAWHVSFPALLAPPPYQKRFVLWRLELAKDILDVADLTVSSAPHFGVFPLMLTNPSQDYRHLKDRRNYIQALKYNGIRTRSSRSSSGGHICALFADQSKNVKSLAHVDIELRLIKPASSGPFTVYATEELDFHACEVQVSATGVVPTWASAYSTWSAVGFNH